MQPCHCTKQQQKNFTKRHGHYLRSVSPADYGVNDYVSLEYSCSALKFQCNNES